MKAIFCFALCAGLLLAGCSKSHTIQPPEETHSFEFKGLLKKLEVTSFQYGSHMITNQGTGYALRSSTVNLDAYVNKTVTVKGSKISGYPVDGGPEFIEVTMVQ